MNQELEDLRAAGRALHDRWAAGDWPKESEFIDITSRADRLMLRAGTGPVAAAAEGILDAFSLHWSAVTAAAN